jgi:hypothetical protein
MVLRFPTWARFESFGSRTQSDPAISSITNRDHDYVFELPWPGSGMPYHYTGDLLHTIDVRALPRANHLKFSLLRHSAKTDTFRQKDAWVMSDSAQYCLSS